MPTVARKLRTLDRLLSLKGQLVELRVHREATRHAEPAEPAASNRFAPGRTLKANSADSILKVCLRKLKCGKEYRKGQLAGPRRLELLQAIRDYGRAWLHHEAEAFLAANDPDYEETSARSLTGAIGKHAARLFSRMKTFVKELYVAGAMALLGPRALTESELHAIDRQHEVQVAYFDRFQQQTGKRPTMIDAQGQPVPVGPEPEQPLDGTFPARAEQYGASVWGAAQEVARASAAAAFKVERRRHIRKDEPCGECVEQLGLEWQPVGTLKPIGQCECLNNCHCFFEYKVDADSERTYYAGETPDNAADFGSIVIDV